MQINLDKDTLESSYPEWLLIFMTLFTQISLGGFFVLFLGDVMSVFGFESANWMMALLIMFPALFALPLLILYLKRPLLLFSIMKNIKVSWFSRELLALGIFTFLMNGVIALYFMQDIYLAIRLLVEAVTLGIGVYGIHAQAMNYRIKKQPSWNRESTNIKFFGATYVGAFLMALFAVVFSMYDIAIPLITLGMLGAMAQMFFSLEDLRDLETEQENKELLHATKRLYDENFHKVKLFRFTSIILGGVILPLLVITQVSAGEIFGASAILFLSLCLVFTSEASDRFLFYTTALQKD